MALGRSTERRRYAVNDVKEHCCEQRFSRTVQVGIYKRSQGRIARQVTFAALAVAIAVWRLWQLVPTPSSLPSDWVAVLRPPDVLAVGGLLAELSAGELSAVRRFPDRGRGGDE